MPCVEARILQHAIARNRAQAQPVGLRSPPRASLKLDTISRSDLVRNCSFRTRRSFVLTHSLVGEWSKAAFSGTMARNFIFPQSITLSCPRSGLTTTFPLVYHESFMLHRGNRRGNSPFCWRSRNQQVPCESLVPFFSQERNCQCGRHEPTKAKIFLKLWFEAECKDNILASAPK